MEKTGIYINKIEKLAGEQLYRIKVNDNEIITLLAATLYFKIYHGFQAVCILAKKGRGVNCASLALSMLEGVLSLKVLSLDNKNNHFGFGGMDRAGAARLIDILINESNVLFLQLSEQLDKGKLQALKNRLQRKIVFGEERYSSLKELADRANMSDFYRYASRVFSHQEFAGVDSLSIYARAGGDCQINRCDGAPYPRDIQLILSAATYMILVALDNIDRIFHLELGYVLAAWTKIFY